MNNYIDPNFKIDDISFVKLLNEKKSPFLSVIKDIFDDVSPLLDNRVQSIFKTYTLHNSGHSFRIMEYMFKLVEEPNQLSELEITLLVCSALCHDVGMAVSSEDVDKIKKDNFPFSDVKFSSMLKLIDDPDLALQEFVRRIHARLSAKYVREHLKKFLKIPKLPNLDFADELALICESHTEDFDWIREKLKLHQVKGDYVFNSQFIACILRLGDILDIDANRAPYRLYENISPSGISEREWRQHFVVQNNDKIVFNPKSNQKRLEFHGKATDANVHRKVLNYIDWVKAELGNSLTLLNGMSQQYGLNIEPLPQIHIATEGYSFSGYKMTLKFEAISSLLMGEKIYGSKSLGLRELIQNSIDACRLRQEEDRKNIRSKFDPYQPKIRVILDPNQNLAIIQDNGIGMSLDVIKNHFLNIGVSYYNSFEFLLRDSEYKPIGNFGIGFLSCFMLSPEVSVTTRHHGSKTKYTIDLKQGNEWTSLTESEDLGFYGTEVKLDYNRFMAGFENKPISVQNFLRKFFLTDEIDFKIIVDECPLPIENSIKPPLDLPTGAYIVDFADYLTEVEGYAIIKKKNEFVASLSDLYFGEEVYLYTDEGELEYTENLSLLNIADFLSGTQLKYLKIPIIESDTLEAFLSGMAYTEEDISDVVDKLSNKLRWISVLYKKELQDELDQGRLGQSTSLYLPLKFSQLTEIGHLGTCDTYVSIERIDLFEGLVNEIYMPFAIRDKPYYYYTSEDRKELFIRNVLIKDFKLISPSNATIFEANLIVANIKSRKFIPDISRNNVDVTSQKSINYMIGKALHRSALIQLQLSENEKLTIDKSINTYYSSSDEIEKV